MGQVTVFSGPEQQRRWREEERRQNLSEAFAPVFAEALIDGDAVSASAIEHPAMIIDLQPGKRLSVFAAASPALRRRR